jgi:hypothetical protein
MTRLRQMILVILCGLQAGCVRPPYRPTGDLYPNPNQFIDEPQISRGEPNVIADSLGNYLFSLPEKLFLWNWKMGSHDISPETEQAMKEYLAVNGLKEVKIRLNEYAPFGEWKRLMNNEAVGGGWRYTVGVVNWLFYTLLPGRIFGGDNYNPLTNTVSLYSDLSPVALHELGHAKDTAEDNYKGSIAALRLLPLYSLRDEAVASTDAITYASEVRNDTELLKSSYKLLYPAYGTYIGGEILTYVPGIRTVALIAGAIPGHIVGRIKSSQVEDAEENSKDAAAESTGSKQENLKTIP